MDEAIKDGELESERDAILAGMAPVEVWLKHIERAKADEKSWRESGKAAICIYEADTDSKHGNDDQPAFNILHSNIETTVPALYNSTPIPDVRRRFGDVDPVAKQAVDVIERALSYGLDQYPFDQTISECVRDGELAGRGIVRVRYEPEVENGQVSYQSVSCEHVIWDRWGHGPALKWADVPWVYFEHDLTKDELQKIGVDESRIKDLAMAGKAEGAQGDDVKVSEPTSGVLKTIKVYEVWDRRSRAVYWIAEQDRKQAISATSDPLQLEGFFPVPSPYQPLRKRKDLTPICPYDVYRPLVMELDKVTRRIAALVSQLRVRGLIDSRLSADLERLRDCEDGHFEPCEDASVFAQGAGGLEKAVAHWPMQEIIAALQQLYVQREAVKQTIYEVTGLSDVLRGATNPNETLGAQQIKAQVGSQRLSQRQNGVARFVRDILRIKTEIICNHFTVEQLGQMTGVEIAPEVEQVLRNDLLRSYKIDIETDSTIRADVARTQEQMSLFLQGTAQFATAMTSVLQLEPGAKGAIVEIYASFARQFKLGKSAEDALSSMAEAAKQPQENKPSPEEQAAELERERMQAEMARDEAKTKAEIQLRQMDMQIKQLDLEVKRASAQIDMQIKQADLAMKREAMVLDQQAKVFDMQSRREMSSIDIEARRKKSEQASQEAQPA